MRQLRYPVLLFDAGDTLLGPREPFGATYARVLAALGVPLSADDLDRGLRTGWTEFNRTHTPGVDRYRIYPGGESEYWLRFVERALAATRGAPSDPGLPRRALEPLRDAFRDPAAWHVFSDVVPALEELRAMGARLGVVSNWDSRLPGLLETLGLARYFDAIVVSHIEGVEKPSPEIFLKAVERLRGSPSTTLHVGDMPDLDEAGARSAGLSSLLVDRFDRLSRSDASVRDLASVPSMAGGHQ